MPRNKLSDLNNHLFAQLERLNDEDLSDEQIDREINRAKAVSKVASEIVKSSKLTLDAVRLIGEGYVRLDQIPENFELKQLNGKKNGVHK